MDNRRAKRSKIWNLVLLMENIWDIFDLVMLKVILDSFGALCDFSRNAIFTTFLYIFVSVAATSCNFEI